ncbi:MAG TPA: hypothetical protein VFL86_00625 [Burkholderiaceae bacterium]|nr:hypothetical protein [Burkholderiaceae bacterium]
MNARRRPASRRRGVPGREVVAAAPPRAAGLRYWAREAALAWLRAAVLMAGGVLVLRALGGSAGRSSGEGDAPLLRPPYKGGAQGGAQGRR